MIWKIAIERYKGWRSTFSATYKAYPTYDLRMKNNPQDLDIMEWHYLIMYFGSKKFRVRTLIYNFHNISCTITFHYIGKHHLFTLCRRLAARTLQIVIKWKPCMWWAQNLSLSVVGKRYKFVTFCSMSNSLHSYTLMMYNIAIAEKPWNRCWAKHFGTLEGYSHKERKMVKWHNWEYLRE